MNYSIIVQPEAEEDLSVAFDWYEKSRVGLGYDFLLQVDAGFNFITRHPNSHENGYAGTKKHLIKRFPYKIIYTIDQNNIVILAVLHSRRNPELLKKRISEQ